MDSELPRPLSAKYKEDFAYPTIKDRLPVILTKAVDTLHRSKAEVFTNHGREGTEQLKSVIGCMSKLRNELQTNKSLTPIMDKGSDADIWNFYLDLERTKVKEDPSWYVSAWLYTECYFYRRIQESIKSSKILQNVDPFKQQKCNALIVSMPAVISLAKFLQFSTDHSAENRLRFLMDFLQISLWGNKCDLSISAGVENAQTISVESSLEHLHPFILSDHKEYIGKYLTKTQSDSHVHIVLDNAGFELFSDLVLIEYLLASKFASSITVHGKAMPWFVSDVTIDDFNWTVEQLKSSEVDVLKHYGNKWQGYIDNGLLVYKASDFWTLPYDYTQMEKIDPDLYKELTLCDLVIFKGDLNYRKLTGDLKWEYDTPLKTALRGFLPTAICALRTIKCDLVVGITKEAAKKTESEDKDWLFDAKWAVLQFAE